MPGVRRGESQPEGLLAFFLTEALLASAWRRTTLTELVAKNWPGGRWHFLAWLAREFKGAITPEYVRALPVSDVLQITHGLNACLAAEAKAVEAARKGGR